MELKEYCETLEKVMTHLQANPKATTREVRELAGEYWVKIKDYLKRSNSATFLADGTLWNVNKNLVNQSLIDVRMKLDEFHQEKKKIRNNRLWDIVLLVLDAAIAFYAGWFLRGCTPEYNTESGTPEPQEQSRSIIDSISLSAMSSSRLNAVSTPSLAKSFTVISDNSASTRLMCSTLKSSIQMDAVQSVFRELPLWLSPSGKLYVTDIFIPQI